MQTRIAINATGDLANAHDAATELAVRCGFGEIATERLGRAAVAAATGMLDHAGGGVLHLRPLQEEVTGAAAPQVEILAVDLPRSARASDVSDTSDASDASDTPDGSDRPDAPRGGDGSHGRARAAGRLAELYELVTALDRYDSPAGSVIRMTLSPADRPGPGSLPAVAVGVVWAPADGDAAPGGLNIHSARGLSTVVLGLGRGAEAARRVAALQGFGAQMQQIDRVRATLPGGGDMALAAAQIEAHAGHVRVAGAGRFCACVVEPGTPGADAADGATTVSVQPLLRHRGALVDGGAMVRGPLAQAQAGWPPHALLVLHDDGLSWPWALETYPGLLDCHPAIVAAVLHRDYCRQPGHGCVLVCRRSAECATPAPSRTALPAAAATRAAPALAAADRDGEQDESRPAADGDGSRPVAAARRPAGTTRRRRSARNPGAGRPAA